MSWSVSYIGTPEKISAALDEQSTRLSGQSKEEFDAALPNLKGLVSQNFNSQKSVVVKLSASGSGWVNGDQKTTKLLCFFRSPVFGLALITLNGSCNGSIPLQGQNPFCCG